MASRSGPSASANSVPKKWAAAAVAVLVVFVLWVAYRSLFASPVALTAPPLKPTPVMDWIHQKAKESGGDINKLSQQDRMQLMMQTSGMGEQLLKRYAHEQ